MRAFVVVGLLVLAAPAAAQPSLPSEGGGLYFTNALATDNLVLGTDVYVMGSEPGGVGAVAFGGNYVYYYHDIAFEHEATGNFSYYDVVRTFVPVRCLAAWAGPLNFAATLSLGSQEILYQIVALPLTCANGQVLDLAVEWNLTMLGVRKGDTLRVRLSSPIGNPGTVPTLEVVTGNPAHPAGIFGNWTSKPLFAAWSDSHNFTTSSWVRQTFFTTGAQGVAANLTGNLTSAGGGRYLDVQIINIVTGDEVLATRYDLGTDERLVVDRQVILNTGGDARWQVKVTSFLDEGSFYNLSLRPVVLQVVENVEAPTTPEGEEPVAPEVEPALGNDTHLPDDKPKKDAPALVLLAPALPLLAAVRRRMQG